MPYHACVYSKLDIWKVNVMQHHYKCFPFWYLGEPQQTFFKKSRTIKSPIHKTKCHRDQKQLYDYGS